jgi:hypothetical protein
MEVKFFNPRILLNSYLNDNINRKNEENYNLITNLKFMFYYEISLNVGSQIQHGNFYNSLSYNKNVILRFFREKFNIMRDIFFSDDSVLNNSDMDICFENYINTKKVICEKNLSTKLEILNILVFLIDNYLDHEILNYDIRRFIIELMDIVVECKENKLIENIKQICNIN